MASFSQLVTANKYPLSEEDDLVFSNSWSCDMAAVASQSQFYTAPFVVPVAGNETADQADAVNGGSAFFPFTATPDEIFRPPSRTGSGTYSQSSRRKSNTFNFTGIFGVQTEEKDLQSVFCAWSTSGIPAASSAVSSLPADDIVEKSTGGWRAIVHHESLGKRQCAQQEAVWELITKEWRYIRNLETIGLFYIAAFENLENRKLNWIQCDHKYIFGNIKELLSANTRMWNDCFAPLIKSTTGAPLDVTCQSMYDGFMKIEQYLEPYLRFCVQYQRLTAYYKAQHKTNVHFRSLMEWFQKHPTSQRHSLSNWLMKPVQQLTRYHILLGAILEKTDAGDQSVRLRRMLTSMENFVHHINGRVRDTEEKEALEAVYARIAGYDVFDSAPEEISGYLKQYSTIEPHLHRQRKIIREFLVKVKRVDEVVRRPEATLFVFSDVVMLCRRSGSKAHSKKLKIFRAPIPLRQIRIHPLRETASFLLVVLDNYQTVIDAHVVFASNPAQMDVLIATITRAADDLDKKQAIILHRNPEDLQVTLDSAEDDCASPVMVRDGDYIDNNETSTDPEVVSPGRSPLVYEVLPHQERTVLERPELVRARSISCPDTDPAPTESPEYLTCPSNEANSRSHSFNEFSSVPSPDGEDSEDDEETRSMGFAHSSRTVSVSDDTTRAVEAGVCSLVTETDQIDEENRQETPDIPSIMVKTSFLLPEISDIDGLSGQTTEKNSPNDSSTTTLHRHLFAKTLTLSHANSFVTSLIKRKPAFRNAKRNLQKGKRHMTEPVTSIHHDRSTITETAFRRRSSSWSDNEEQKASPTYSNGSSKSGSSLNLGSPNGNGSMTGLDNSDTVRQRESMYSNMSSGFGGSEGGLSMVVDTPSPPVSPPAKEEQFAFKTSTTREHVDKDIGVSLERFPVVENGCAAEFEIINDSAADSCHRQPFHATSDQTKEKMTMFLISSNDLEETYI